MRTPTANKKPRLRAANRCYFSLISSISVIENKNNIKQSKNEFIVIYATSEA